MKCLADSSKVGFEIGFTRLLTFEVNLATSSLSQRYEGKVERGLWK